MYKPTSKTPQKPNNRVAQLLLSVQYDNASSYRIQERPKALPLIKAWIAAAYPELDEDFDDLPDAVVAGLYPEVRDYGPGILHFLEAEQKMYLLLGDKPLSEYQMKRLSNSHRRMGMLPQAKTKAHMLVIERFKKDKQLTHVNANMRWRMYANAPDFLSTDERYVVFSILRWVFRAHTTILLGGTKNQVAAAEKLVAVWEEELASLSGESS